MMTFLVQLVPYILKVCHRNFSEEFKIISCLFGDISKGTGVISKEILRGIHTWNSWRNFRKNSLRNREKTQKKFPERSRKEFWMVFLEKPQKELLEESQNHFRNLKRKPRKKPRGNIKGSWMRNKLLAESQKELRLESRKELFQEYFGRNSWRITVRMPGDSWRNLRTYSWRNNGQKNPKVSVNFCNNLRGYI